MSEAQRVSRTPIAAAGLGLLLCVGARAHAVGLTGFETAEADPLVKSTFDGATWTAPPVLIGQKDSPLLELTVETEGCEEPKTLSAVEFALSEGVEAVREISFGGLSAEPEANLRFEVNTQLNAGANSFALTCELLPEASLDAFVSVICTGIQIEGDETLKPEPMRPVRRKIGIALRQRGQDGVHTYRIPGLTTTNAGSLIAVYDNRNRGSRDLPGDIDVGMSRSTDGGQTWSPMQVIMDMGSDPEWEYDGIGDPSILTDRVTGTIWVAATWSHSNRSWRGLGPGMTPEETGQLMLVKSDDEGLTWPEKWHTLYDERPGYGYSSLTQVDEDHIGVLYEGEGELYFLRYGVEELVNES